MAKGYTILYTSKVLKNFIIKTSEEYIVSFNEFTL